VVGGAGSLVDLVQQAQVEFVPELGGGVGKNW